MREHRIVSGYADVSDELVSVLRTELCLAPAIQWYDLLATE